MSINIIYKLIFIEKSMKFQFKKILLCLSSISFASFSISGCSGGGAVTGSNTQPQYNQGPVSFVEILNIFNPESATTQNSLQSNKLLAGGGGCGSVMSDVGAGSAAASGFLGLIPRAGPALSAVTSAVGATTSFIGASGENACIQMQFSQINNQLAEQESQIQGLQTEINLNNNDLWNALAANSRETAYANLTNLNITYTDLTGTGSLVPKFFEDAGFWVNGQAQPSIESAGYLLSNPKNYKLVQELLNNWSSRTGTDNIVSEIDTIVGTSTPVAFATQVQGNMTIYYPENVSANILSELMTFYYSLYQAYTQGLVSNIQSNSNYNIIPTIDEYNQAISASYQKSLNTLLAVYQVAYLANQVNYLSYLNRQNTKNYLDGIFAEYLTYTPIDPTNLTTNNLNTNTQAYNQAQASLSFTIGIYINFLYINSVGYIITDKPQNNNYPSGALYYNPQGIIKPTGESINYAKIIGKYVSSAESLVYYAYQNSDNNQSAGINLTASLTSLTSESSSQSLLYYQYEGILNNSTYQYKLYEYLNSNPSNPSFSNLVHQEYTTNEYPQMFTTTTGAFINQAIASWNTIQLYLSGESTNAATFMGSVENNILSCNPASVGNLPGYNLYEYIPQTNYQYHLGMVGKPYLMCGNWSTAGFPENGQITFSNATSLNSYTLNPLGNFGGSYTYGTNFYYAQTSSQNPYNASTSDAISLWMAENGSYPTSNMAEITLLNFNQQNWSSTSTNFNNSNGDVVNYLNANWMATNYPSSIPSNGGVANLAAIQITLPDGFIAPVVLSFANISGWGGNYVALAPNPNAKNVTIESSSLYGLDTTSAFGTYSSNDWAPLLNSNYSYSYGNGSSSFLGSGFTINNNTVLLNGAGFENSPYDGQQMQNADAWIVLNPSSCPSLIANPANEWTWVDGLQAYMYYTNQQSYNWICNW